MDKMSNRINFDSEISSTTLPEYYLNTKLNNDEFNKSDKPLTFCGPALTSIALIIFFSLPIVIYM